MDSRLFAEIQRMLAPVVRKLRLVIGRAVVESANDSGGMQTLRAALLQDEEADEIEHFQPGGLTHVPLPGAEGVSLAVGASREGSVVVCVSRRAARPTGLAGGDTALWNDSPRQSMVVLRSNGDVEVLPANQMRVGANPVSAVALALATDARFAALEAKLNAHLTIYNTHVHPHPIAPTAPTPSVDTPIAPGQSTASAIHFSE